jgi:hypothetical protein
MVPNYDINEANVVQKYTRGLSLVDSHQFPRKQEESRVITPKPSQHRVSYDIVPMATPRTSSPQRMAYGMSGSTERCVFPFINQKYTSDRTFLQ